MKVRPGVYYLPSEQIAFVRGFGRGVTPLMSIAHELSSDVAAAVLSAEEGEAPGGPGERAELVLEVHSTLRRLGVEHRRKGRASKGGDEGPPLGEGAASGRS